MSKRHGLRSSIVFGLATLCLASQAFSKTLEYTGDGLPSQSSMPEGCDNPFAESKPFFDFYESTIATIAVERGADAKGVAGLFAVSELASDLLHLVPNHAEESPIDRLIRGQLCQYKEIYTQKRDSRIKRKDPPTNNDTDLHEHLVKISSRLFKDSLKIVETVLVAQANDAQRMQKLKRRASNIQKARKLGRSKIDQNL